MLSIGLLLYDGEKLWLQFSNERRSVARQLLQDKHHLIDFLTKQIQLNVTETNRLLDATRTQLFDLQHLISSEKFTYLSNYSNGVIRFSAPVFLNDTVDESKFHKLFKLFIDTSERETAVSLGKVSYQNVVQQKLISKVENIVHTNLDLTPAILPAIYYNFHIDCLGKNGSLVGAKFIAFDASYRTIDKELSHYFSLISLLDKQEEREDDKDCFYILGEEPKEIESDQHRAWESLRKNPVVEVLHPEQAGIVTEKILQKGATTFLGVI